jgi:hypothetical protein
MTGTGSSAVSAANPAGERSLRRFAIEALAVALVVLAAYGLTHPDAVASLGRLYDDVVYLSVGKSIADGEGYRSAHLVGTPVHVKFPPLLPAIYAVAWRALGSLSAVANAAMWLNVVVASAAAGLLWWLTRRQLGVGVVVCALFVIVPILTDRTMFYFSGAMSEPWMLLGWVLSLLLVCRLARLRASGKESLATAIALGLVLAGAMLARAQSVAVAAGVIVGAGLMRVGWRSFLVTIASTAIPTLAWRFWHGAMVARGPVSPLPDQLSYASWLPTGIGELTDLAALMVRISVPVYWRNTADLLVGWTSAKTLAIGAAVVTWGLIGLVALARRFPALGTSVAAMIVVTVTWPYVQDRFLTPVLPVLGVAGAYATQRVVDRSPRVLRNVMTGALALAAIVLLGVNLRARFESARGQLRAPFSVALTGIVDWVNQNTSATQRVMVPWGGAIYLRTGRRTSIPNPEEALVGPSVFDSPRRFLATRILVDTVDVVVIWNRAPGRAAASLRGMAVQCPGFLTEARAASTDASGLHFYRVRRDLPCLRQLATIRVDSGGQNNNAP